MSGNGKQVQLAPNQPPRFTSVARSHTPRADSYSVGSAGVTQAYVSGGGGPHLQSGGMRTLPQPSTPPQQEVKQPLYPPNNVRASAPAPQYQYRGGPPQPPPGNVVPRGSAHHRQQGGWTGPNLIYNMTPAVYLQAPLHTLPPSPFPPQQQAQRQFYSQPPSMPMMQQQHPYYNYSNGPPQQQYLTYGSAGGGATPGGALGLATAGGRPAPAPLQPPGLQQPSPPQLPYAPRYSTPMQHPTNTLEKKRTRSHAIPIVDPKSGKDVTDEIFEDDNSETVSEAGDNQSIQSSENCLTIAEKFKLLVTDAANKKDPSEESNKPLEKSISESECNILPNRENVMSLPFQDVTTQLKMPDTEFIEDKHKIGKQTVSSEINVTPVVSAISNSPEIVPKQPHSSIKQKQNDLSNENKKPSQSSAKFGKHNKPLNIQENICDDVITSKFETTSESREFQAQKILTSALQPVKPSEDLQQIKPEDDLKILDIQTCHITKTKTNASCSLDVEKSDDKTDVINSNKTISKAVSRESSLENQKVKSESKKNKSRFSNDKLDKNASQNNKSEFETSDLKSEHSPVNTEIIESASYDPYLNEYTQIEINSETEPLSSCTNEISDEIYTVETKLEVHVDNSEIDKHVSESFSNTVQSNMDKIVSSNEDLENRSVQVIDVMEDCSSVPDVTQNDLNSVDEQLSQDVPEQDQTTTENVQLDLDSTQAFQEKPVKTPILRYTYKDGQWSPLNTGGKKCYDQEFLMMLRNDPNSKKKPENINQLEIVSDVLNRQPRNNSDVSRSMSIARHNDLLPGFAKVSHGATPNRKSQHGKPNAKGVSASGSSVGNRPNIIHVNLSLRCDVKLNEVENAWKPSRMRSENFEEEAVATQELYKTFRSVLNKLTPQKFDTLISQVRKLNIDTEERLKGVINLVFEKAVDEPNFSLAYALMCKELEQIKVRIPTENEKEEKFVSFRALILGRCQVEFEKEDKSTKTKQKEVDECSDPEKKKELILNLEEEERKIRRRSVGNVRFIGELYKQNLITNHIITHCIKKLLNKIEEETLECLCKLLTTIGKDLERTGGVDLQPYFNNMKAIVDSKEQKVSNRVRFMLQDVIDLRLNSWVPRQQVVNPKTMDQIKLEVEMEQKTAMYNFSSASNNTGRKDDRPNNMNKRGGSKSVTEESGWSTASSRNNRNKQPNYVVDSVKLIKMCSATPVILTSLQPATQNTWSKGSVITNKKLDNWTPGHKPNSNSSNNRKPTMETTNSFTPLDNQFSEISSNNRTENSSSKKTNYKSKGASIERSTFKPDSEDQDTNISNEMVLDKMKDILIHAHSEYAPSILSKIQENFSKQEMHIVIRELILWGFECNKTDEMRLIGEITGSLVEEETISSSEFLCALKQTVDTSTSYFTKPGNLIWTLISSFIWAHIKINSLQLREIHGVFSKVIEIDKGFELLSAIILEKLKRSPSEIQSLWEKSNMDLSDWMSEDKVDQFLEEFTLKWITQKRTISPEDACSHMLKMMQENQSRDAIKKWIDENVGRATQDAWFVRALSEAIHIYGLCPNGLAKPKFDPADTPKRLEVYYPLLCTYTSGQEDQELECLFAIQHLLHKLEYPQGITVQLFEYIWESTELISSDGFIAWEKNNDPKEQEGKGVMLKLLTSFFTSIKSVDESSDEATSVIDDECC